MKIKCEICIREYVSRLWNEYNGDKNMTQWIRSEKKSILKTFAEKLNKIEMPYDHKYTLTYDHKYRNIIIEWEWQEKENIEYWTNEVKANKQKILQWAAAHNLLAF